MRSSPSLPELASPIEVAAERADLDALRPIWESLEDATHPGAAFRSWAWISAWWNSFSAGKEPFVLSARAGGKVVGLLPLFCDRTIIGGRRVALMGEGIVGSDYLGCVGGDEAARAFAEFLASYDCDELSLDGLLPDDPLAVALQEKLGERALVDERYRCPHITLAGTFERYIAELPDGAGQQWKRRLRWLEKRDGFRMEELTAPDAVVAAMTPLWELHHKRWAVEGGSDAIDSPEVEAFHRDAARRLAERGWARLALMHVEGKTVAAWYGFRHGDRFAFYQAGYDPEWRQRSVGTVLLGWGIERCFADGVREFDFLRGTESYKLKWANGWRHTIRVRAPGPSLRARLFGKSRDSAQKLYSAAKRALPADALDFLRRAKKQVSRGSI
jgi:CelD/BcsL family acetyltransferase involved in cellulose biosynthesis